MMHIDTRVQCIPNELRPKCQLHQRRQRQADVPTSQEDFNHLRKPRSLRAAGGHYASIPISGAGSSLDID
jgi:hypothetical protein